MHIEHMIVSSVVHGLVYGTIFKVFRALPLGAAVLVGVVGVGAMWALFRRR